MRTPTAALVLALLPAARVRSAGTEGFRWIERNEDYSRDPRLPALVRVAEEATTEALARIRSELRLEPGRLGIRWVLDLSRSAGAAAAVRPLESGRTHVGEREVEVVLPARKYLWDPSRARPVVIHEAVHAVMASAAGSEEANEAIPRWFREGLALRVSGEGDLLFADTLAYTAFLGQPAASFLKGVRARDASYAEAFLAVSELERKLGGEGIGAFVRDVVGGAAVERLMETRLGLKLDAFEAHVVARGRERVRELLGEETERAFLSAIAARARGEGARAHEVFSKLLEAQPDGVLSSTLRYLVAKAFLDGGRSIYAAALASLPLEQLLDSRSTLWRAEALVLRGECQRREYREDDARKTWLQVLEVFGEDSGPADEARRKLGEHR